MRAIIRFGAYFALALCALSFLGFVHPVFDSIAIFRPLIWIIAGVGSFALASGHKEAMRALLVVMAIPFFIMFDQSEAFETSALRIYQHNLLYTNPAPDLQMVVDRRLPDALTLQEISKARDTVQNLEGYEFQQICDFASVGDVAILSRTAFTAQGCSMGKYRGFAWGRIKNEKGREVTIVSLHLHWPYPYSQPSQLEELLPQLEALPQPIVLAGDINHVAWSFVRRDIEAATQSKVISGLRFTLVRPPIFLPIDHVFGNGVHYIERLERYGSDHNALLIDFAQWPERAG